MYLLDTNVISELRKIKPGKADRNVAAWSASVAAEMLFVSTISLHEIEHGILLKERSDPTQGAILRAWFDNHVLPAFAGRVLDVDTAVALRSARLHVPDPRPTRDAFIAGTALQHGMTIVSRNTADFEPMGTTILNPWEVQC